MEFTKEAWENAPEGARLESRVNDAWIPVHFVGWSVNGIPVVQSGSIFQIHQEQLRIILPKRKVTVQLWGADGYLYPVLEGETVAAPNKLLGEHTFEIEGE